jgi:Cdc6-like AAA superfamily ATPase
MQAWFGLKEVHNDFSIETEADAALFFARHELDEQLQAILRRSFRTGNPPKMVLYGDWGVGKTHTMRHMEYVIEHTEAFKAIVVFVELPDITSRSTFQVAHSALLDAVGFERAKQWVLQFQSRHPTNARDLIREFTQSGDIATAFANMLAFGEGSRIGWDWLRGLPLTAADARLAGLPPSLSQSNLLVRVLQMLGRFSEEVEAKLLVFMLDEATKLQYVTNQDAVNHWVNSFKLLADQQTKEMGFIVTGSWVDQDDMALPLLDQQVVTRFGMPNYIQLQRLDDASTRVFIRALLEEWINPTKRQQLIDKFGADEADSEAIGGQTFPFTEPGLDIAVQYACRHGGNTTPRDIQVTLDELLNRAIDDGRHIVASSYIGKLVGA